MDGVTLLDFAPRARYSMCFCEVAHGVFEAGTTVKNHSRQSKARLLIWAVIFQYSDFKLLDLGSNLKRGPFILSPNAAFYVILIKKKIKLLITRFFFSFKYLFLLAITNKKRGITVLLSLQRQQKGQFRLQMGILRAGTGASFKPNTILAG